MVLMNTGRTVFSQLMDDLPTYEFLNMCESLFRRSPIDRDASFAQFPANNTILGLRTV